MGTQPPPQHGAPNFRPVYCGQTAGCIKMPLGMEVSLSSGDFVLDGDPAPSPKRGRSRQFSAHVCCGQTTAWIKMYGGRPRPGRHCVRWGPSSPSPNGAQQFSAHICCGQMAAWIKTLFGMGLGLGPGDFVLDGDPAPLSHKGVEPPPQFSAHFY